MNNKITNLVRRHLGADIDDAIVNVITEKVLAKLNSEISGSLRRGSENDPVIMELIVGLPSSDAQVSIKLTNLFSSINVIGVRQFFAVYASSKTISTGGMVDWIAFVLAMTGLAARTVPFVETCILHKAWRLAGFNRVITVDDLVQAGPDITIEYDIVKVTKTDIQTYINTLVRLGCIVPHQYGYELVEKIAFR